MQKIIYAAAFLFAVCSTLGKSSSNSISDEEDDSVERDHSGRQSWRNWQPRPSVTRKPTWTKKIWKPRPKKTTKPKPTFAPTASPDICQKHTKVSSVEKEKGPVVCLRRNGTELMSQLRSVGGYITRYMAVNASDACAFEDLTSFNLPEPSVSSPPATTRRPITATTSSRRTTKFGNPSDEQTESDALLQRLKRNVPTAPGTYNRGCQGRGTIPDGSSLHRLCTECSATTVLADGRYPKYINEVVCRDKDHQCTASMGLCLQRSLKLPFLQLTNKFQIDSTLSIQTGKTVFKEVWVQYTQEIRSCCECRVFNHVYQTFATRSRG